eukprot:CAMPEP_0183353290 /NCGR_PEP_ID=MMETSP0164_2-20130417/33171_1 /TAXON_ID=221442 /ORGANISM="Coccolithus pelagicus ssp braarudi, Strain PLY182g" /LENGTH=387 /DNA_ID=CAMNT_0025525945 /DNA_START=38 /DNA_END=1201 /DNA_ORIENTATION=-
MPAAARPQISVRSVGDDKADGVGAQIALPRVLVSAIRSDIVHFVHSNMAKNSRQAYAVNEMAGMQHSAHSWGTGRAVSRIPRISGSGTGRAAQGAFGNMCRQGRMFGPTKTFRKWHRKINQNQRRYAVASALAATALPALVQARGHKIDEVPEVPLVVPSSVESISTTKAAIGVLQAVGAYQDVEKAASSKKLRAGKGKMRNRRYTQRRGPLVVYNEDNGVVGAFRNLPGVELCQVDRLNLLQLAPGGHLGRFVVWTKAAFDRLDEIWGTGRGVSKTKKNYKLPAPMMSNSDITRIINSDEVQSKLRAPVKSHFRARRKKNPLRNLGAMVRLNPYALSMRRAALLAADRRSKNKESKIEAARKARTAALKKKHAGQKKKNYARISRD